MAEYSCHRNRQAGTSACRAVMALGNLIDGRAIAEQIHTETAARIAKLKSRGIEPCLFFVRVGEDPVSKVYVGMKERTSRRLGIRSETKVLNEATSETDLLSLIRELNSDRSVHGILVQAPLPAQINPAHVYSAVSP